MRLPMYLLPILYRFQDMVDYWSSFRHRQGCLSLTQSFGMNSLIEDYDTKFGPKKIEISFYDRKV